MKGCEVCGVGWCAWMALRMGAEIRIGGHFTNGSS